MLPQISNADRNFNDWVALIGQSDQLSDESKQTLLSHLKEHRRVMIVDVRHFFVDAVKTGQLDNVSRHPIGLLSHGIPMVLLEVYPDLSSAVEFCEATAMDYDIHCYNAKMFSTIKQ